MGVPKFFRYISERYPCLSEFVREYQIPAFDNLYLDMNGIIHMCSHPDDNNPHFRITEEKLFADIFHYIEVLFRMIKPQKVFFMAVDGVAPRAKMNQQRGRRFRSAKDAEKMEAEAKKRDEKLPETARFDSNCITPGTKFMAKLQEQLKYFVVNKVSNDKLWKKCKVILSGHETPGEGEHKIMDYIRYIRAQPGYDPNTRHCLYGLDADLIMLGLCTHDPHFSLLREEVKFGKKSTKRNYIPEEIRFYLLHLSLMREYLELEFSELKEELKKSGKMKFDIEKIIDDWILMSFLVGNDFIPNLPNLHIVNGSLPVLYKAYKDVLPTLDGYINESGTLNLERFEKFMLKLSDIDVKNFEEIRDDLLYMEAKTGRKQTAHIAVSTKGKRSQGDESHTVDGSKKMDPALAALIQITNDMDTDTSEDEETDADISSDEDTAFKSYKDEYYRNKLEYQVVTPEVMRQQAEGYVTAIQWNLNYYYNGVCSWSWFYPHHYAPYISDIRGFADFKIEFDLGQPFKPYEQLLAVLPAGSKDLLPVVYHKLMTDENSPIRDYYPNDFQTDLNGKKQEWEAVVLVPFIDEKVLLEAMKPCNDELSEEEIKRNTHGPMLVYQYYTGTLDNYEAPDYFPTVTNNHALCTPLYIEDLKVDKDKLVKGAYPGAYFDVFYPGFPTMKHLMYEGELRKAKVKVFEHPSRNENMILKILTRPKDAGQELPEELLGQTVWVGWPHLVEAKVEAISNEKHKYSSTSNNGIEREERICNGSSQFNSEVESVTQQFMNRMGVDFGKVEVLIHVKLMTGRKYVFTANGRINLQKQFAPVVSNFPIQSVVSDISVHDESHTTFRNITDVFPVGSTCFSLAYPHYGSMATVLDSTESLKNNKLTVSLLVVKEPDFTDLENYNEKLKNNYVTATNCASQLRLSNYVFSRVTGSLFIETTNSEGSPKSVNIGLDLKYNKKNQETPGYTKKIENIWCYSSKAVALVRDYFEKFPQIFHYLSRSKNPDELDADEIFGDNDDETLKSIQNWLKTLPTYNIERRVCGSSVLEPDIVERIRETVENYKKDSSRSNYTMQLQPQFLYKPELQMGNLCPDPLTKTRIFDRIVNVAEGFTVPLGLKGTVVAIHKPANVLDNNDELFDIIFDDVFVGGMTLNCSDNRGFRLNKNSFINLSHGKRELEQKTGVPGKLRALAREKQTMNFNQFYKNHNPKQQQTSAFASFNKSQNPVNKFNNTKKTYQVQMNKDEKYGNFQYLTDFTRGVDESNKFNKENYKQQKSEIGQQRSSRNQKPENRNLDTSMPYSKDKNPVFSYMADFTRSHDESNKFNRANLLQQSDNTAVVQQLNSQNSKPEVLDTDLLKRILKIDDGIDAVPSPQSASQSNPVFPSPAQAGPSQPISIDRPTKAVASIISYYQSKGWGCPRYIYQVMVDCWYARLDLPNKKFFIARANTREEASECVAAKALEWLRSVSSQPPSNFPVPPVQWVDPKCRHQNIIPTQIFSNSSNQIQQNPVTGASAVDNRSMQNVGNNAHLHSFVPLQAIKKRQSNKNGNNLTHTLGKAKSDHVHSANRKVTSEAVEETKEVKLEKVKTRSENGNRPRRPRIAANFHRKH